MKKTFKALTSIKLVLLMALACSLAAIMLIQVRFKARSLQAELNELTQLEVELHQQNRRYLIELASVTDYPDLYIKATKEHEMKFPDVQNGSLVNLRQLQHGRQYVAGLTNGLRK